MHSPTITALLPALASAIADMSDPRKNTVNLHFKNKYADLGEVIECSESALVKHHLLVTETLETDGNNQVLRTRVWHIPTGEWMDSVVRLMVGKAEMQPLGSAITYARRYARKSLFGMVDVDDDGKRSQTPAKAAKEGPPPVQPFGLVEEAVALLSKVNGREQFKLWEERLRMSGFSAGDREQAINARNERVAELRAAAEGSK